MTATEGELGWPVRLAIGTAGAVVFGLLAWGVHALVTGKEQKPPRSVQIVQIIRPPPQPEVQPPPPPPPEKVDEPLPQDEPEPAPNDAPAPSQQLGLDSEGGAGSDAFGLAARKGGHDIAGNGGAVFAWYTQILHDSIVDQLAAERQLRTKKFTVVVRVWIGSDGRVQSARLATTSGSREVDGALEAALGRLGRLREPPPLEMPQPVSLKIVSRS